MPRTALLAAALAALMGTLVGCSDPKAPSPFEPIEEEEEQPPPEASVQRIYLAKADGSEVTLLTEGAQPAWSWDGRSIAFVREASSAGPAGIYVMNADGSDQRFLRTGGQPAWSPDGRIAFVNWGSSYAPEIYVMNDDGSGVRLLRSNRWATDSTGIFWHYGAALTAPAWSPDGQRIAFTVGSDGGPSLIYVMNADGSEPRPLHPESCPQWLGWPVWSPDGSTIAFSGCPGISTVAATGGSPRQVHWAFGDELAWSPDGSAFAFRHWTQAVGEPAIPAIWVVSSEGSAARVLIPHAFSPAWSPDGRIAFVSSRDE